jgi:ribosomal protein S18 acetylase RimI-like enzyme
MQIGPVTRHSLRQAAQLLGRAFVDEPVSAAVYRNFSPSRRTLALTNDFSAELSVCIQRGYPLQLEQDGETLAVAAIYPPGTYPLPVLDGWLLLAKSIFQNGLYDIRNWLRWLAEAEKNHPTSAHYYVAYIGVEPALQGRALGSMLLSHLANRADVDRVGCYLESANPRNLPFYQRFGFEILMEKVVIGLPAWFMWRPPNNKNT